MQRALLRQMRAEEVHVLHICMDESKADEELGEAQKLRRQKETGTKTSVFSARTVNNHLYEPTCGF